MKAVSMNLLTSRGGAASATQSYLTQEDAVADQGTVSLQHCHSLTREK